MATDRSIGGSIRGGGRLLRMSGWLGVGRALDRSIDRGFNPQRLCICTWPATAHRRSQCLSTPENLHALIRASIPRVRTTTAPTRSSSRTSGGRTTVGGKGNRVTYGVNFTTGPRAPAALPGQNATHTPLRPAQKAVGIFEKTCCFVATDGPTLPKKANQRHPVWAPRVSAARVQGRPCVRVLVFFSRLVRGLAPAPRPCPAFGIDAGWARRSSPWPLVPHVFAFWHDAKEDERGGRRRSDRVA